MRRCDVSILVPALNEEPTLEILAKDIEAVFAQRPDLAFELVFIDDGSTDGSWNTICRLAEEHQFVRGERLRRRLRKGSCPQRRLRAWSARGCPHHDGC